MSFEVGDLVQHCPSGPFCGDCEDDSDDMEPAIAVVAGVYHRPHWTTAGLLFVGETAGPDDRYWCACRFRKINDEPDNAELVERIKRCKPVEQTFPRIEPVRQLNPEIWGEKL